MINDIYTCFTFAIHGNTFLVELSMYGYRFYIFIRTGTRAHCIVGSLYMYTSELPSKTLLSKTLFKVHRVLNYYL